jgi:monovalent cation:H+ antiporter-2, CPA2 family
MPLHFLGEAVALFAAAAAIAYLCQRLGLVPIVGFLLAGVLIGPNALGLVRDQELVDSAAEIGIILLLFTIGVDFSLEKLARIQRIIFLGGGLQVGLTVAAVTAVLLVLGVPWQVGVFTGCLVALSSTAIVLKLLGDRGETGTAAGQSSLGILIFQDLAIIVMVLLLPILAGEGGSGAAIGWALLKAAAIIVLVLVFARRLMPLVLERVARTCSPELFLLSVISICFGTAWLTSLAGVSVSLGAFLAGLVVSESRFSQHAFSEILPLRMLFSATFFVSVGMLLDPWFLLRNLPLVAGAITAVLLLKIATTTLSVRALGQPLATSAAAGLLLAQVGEFSFVLERAGRTVGLYPAGLMETGGQTFVATTVLLMVLTPFLAEAGSRLEARLGKRAPSAAVGGARTAEPAHEAHGHSFLRDHVILGGYGESARLLTRLLREERVPHVVLTLSPDGAMEAEAAGIPVIRGDYTRRHVLDAAGIRQARMLVIADDDPATAHQTVAVARVMNPALEIVVRTRTAAEAEVLHHAGASRVVPEELEGTARLAAHALSLHAMASEETEARLHALRTDGHLALPGLRIAAMSNGASAPHGSAGDSDSSLARLHPDPRRARRCSHLGGISEVVPSAAGCEDCLRIGDPWLHLRICMTCGHVGCCDSSKNRHARAHFHETGHPIIKSHQPSEQWGWCYVDEAWL